VTDPLVRTATAEAQAAIRGMVAEARAAMSDLTTQAHRSAVATVAGIQTSVTQAVSDAAHQISADFAALVNKQLTEMTDNFKKSHPAVIQAVTDVVGYTEAVVEVAGGVKKAAAELKELPGAVRDIRIALKDTVSEVGKLGRELGTLGRSGRTAAKDLGSVGAGAKELSAVESGAGKASGAVGRFAQGAAKMAGSVRDAVRELISLAAAHARAAVQTAVNTARAIAAAVAQKVVAVATRLWSAAQALLNLAMRLNPLGLIITAITVVIGLIVLAYKRSGTFREIVQAAMRGVAAAIGWVVNAAKAVVDWIKNHWPLLLAIITGPIGIAVALVVKNWDRIKAAAVSVKDGIVRAWNSLVDWVRGLGGRIAGAARGMWDGIKAAFRSAINWVIHAWNGLSFHIPGFSLGPVHFGGFTLGVPHIPELAQGALVPHRPGGVLAVLGEGHEDELVVPLSRLGKLAGGLGRDVTVNVYPRPGQSEYEIGRIAARELAWAAKH
jgi:phage-related protein